MGFWNLKITLSGMHPLTIPYLPILPKQLHKLGTKNSNMWANGGHYPSTGDQEFKYVSKWGSLSFNLLSPLRWSKETFSSPPIAFWSKSQSFKHQTKVPYLLFYVCSIYIKLTNNFFQAIIFLSLSKILQALILIRITSDFTSFRELPLYFLQACFPVHFLSILKLHF